MVRETQRAGRRQVTLGPGEHYVSHEPIMLATLLGSCVAACLYDPLKKIVGMNHFLLASRRNSQDTPLLQSELGRYGCHAMEELINNMLRHGAAKARLKAKVFGGGDVLKFSGAGNPGLYGIGSVNSRFVREYLLNEGIEITASDLGGDHGRKIYFRSEDFAVFVKRISHSDDQEVIRQERQYLDSTVLAQRSGTESD